MHFEVLAPCSLMIFHVTFDFININFRFVLGSVLEAILACFGKLRASKKLANS